MVRPFASVILLAALLGAPAVAGPARAETPNVVLITVDALRPDRLGSMGYWKPLTPTLDSLASSGTMFTNAFANSAWTSASLVSCLTGRHEPAHGVDTREKSLSRAVATLAGVLADAGYHAPDICYLVGSPNYQNLRFHDFPQKQEFLTTGHDILFRWLDDYATSNQPFFLYYHFRDLHQPYNPSPPFDSLFMPQDVPRDPATQERIATVRNALLLPEGKLSFAATDTGWVRGLYDGQVAEADSLFFQPLFHRFRSLGIDSNTVVIISADHGEELLEHGNIGHASTSLTSTLYDEELRIPLIVSWPQGLQGGQRSKDLVQLVDIMPTVLDLVGVPIPEGVQGRSLTPLLKGMPLPPQPVFVSSVLGGYQATAQMQGIRLRAVRTDRWKLVRRDEAAASTRQLFHIESDPMELSECSALHPGMADSLEGLLESWLARCRSLYRAPLWAHDSRDQGPAVRPVIISPQPGDSLAFAASDGRLGVRLNAEGRGDMNIEYVVGEGTYRVEGAIPSEPDGVLFGPFTPTFWNTLSHYNPWAFRVVPAGHPDLATPWVTFFVKPCDL
ncbi:sulfatase [Candidatus Fermentibacteria bacterium]|nr:sulfatase [Candidatus Fermentibacteria bacterium]